MTNVTELSGVINKLKKIAKGVKDSTTEHLLETFIEELESELQTQEDNFNSYFGET